MVNLPSPASRIGADRTNVNKGVDTVKSCSMLWRWRTMAKLTGGKEDPCGRKKAGRAVMFLERFESTRSVVGGVFWNIEYVSLAFTSC